MSHNQMDGLFRRCHPNFLMNVGHAYIVAGNPSCKDTLWYGISDRGVKSWEILQLKCKDEDDIIFYEEADMIILSYSRAITAAYKRWETEVKLAHAQFERNEKQLTKSVTLRALFAVAKWLFKLAIVAGLGGLLAILIGLFIPHHVSEVTGINLPAAIGALTFAVISIITSTIWTNRLWSTAAAELQWCLGAAEEELERSSIEAFDLHWFQFCDAYKSYTGLDYNAEPSFISIMRNKLRARERWNRKLMYRMTGNVRISIELIRRVLSQYQLAKKRLIKELEWSSKQNERAYLSPNDEEM
jgi:hypothetical protein